MCFPDYLTGRLEGESVDAIINEIYAQCENACRRHTKKPDILILGLNVIFLIKQHVKSFEVFDSFARKPAVFIGMKVVIDEDNDDRIAVAFLA